MHKKAIIFGAGNIGRGFLAEILQKGNYTFTFVDVNKEIIKNLNDSNSYKINYLSTNESYLIKDSFQGLEVSDTNLTKAIKEASLILTAIGVNNLSKLNNAIAPGIKASLNKTTIMACENAVRGTSQWKETLEKLVDLNKENIQCIDAVVDRIVPNQSRDTIDVKVENYFSIIGDKKQIKFNPNIDTIEFNDNFDSYVERKLYLVNAVHAYIAWLGISKNIKTIHESLDDKEILSKSKTLVSELVTVLNHQYGLNINDLSSYGKTSIKRFQNRDLNDSCLRVGAGVLRKISKGSRIAKPLTYALENNLACDTLKNALYLGLTIKNDNDPETKERDSILKDNFEEGAKKITNISNYSS